MPLSTIPLQGGRPLPEVAYQVHLYAKGKMDPSPEFFRDTIILFRACQEWEMVVGETEFDRAVYKLCHAALEEALMMYAEVLAGEPLSGMTRSSRTRWCEQALEEIMERAFEECERELH